MLILIAVLAWLSVWLLSYTVLRQADTLRTPFVLGTLATAVALGASAMLRLLERGPGGPGRPDVPYLVDGATVTATAVMVLLCAWWLVGPRTRPSRG
jgi:hypothetical protein